MVCLVGGLQVQEKEVLFHGSLSLKSSSSLSSGRSLLRFRHVSPDPYDESCPRVMMKEKSKHKPTKGTALDLIGFEDISVVSYPVSFL